MTLQKKFQMESNSDRRSIRRSRLPYSALFFVRSNWNNVVFSKTFIFTATLQDDRLTSISPFADFAPPVQNFAQNFGDPWIKDEPFPASGPLPPILPNTNFEDDSNSGNPFSGFQQSTIPVQEDHDSANPFYSFPKSENSLQDNPEFDEHAHFNNPGLSNPGLSNPGLDNSIFANPSLNDWRRNIFKDENSVHGKPTLDDPTLDDLDDLLLNNPKLVNPSMSGDELLDEGFVEADKNVLGLRTSNAILKQNILQLDRALLNLQPEVRILHSCYKDLIS